MQRLSASDTGVVPKVFLTSDIESSCMEEKEEDQVFSRRISRGSDLKVSSDFVRKEEI